MNACVTRREFQKIKIFISLKSCFILFYLFLFFFPLYVSQRNRIEIRRRINNFRHSVIVNRKRRRKIRADISNLVERSSRVYSFSPPILSRKLVGWKRVVRLHVSISRIDDFTRTGSLHH